MPKISIIIPIYNAESYLKECIESVCKQTLKDIEIICVDDGSTDSSPTIMDNFEKKDTRVSVIHKENSGYGNSMNRGLSVAKGTYIGIVESDDYIAKDMYASLYALSEKDTVDVIKSNFWDCYDEKDGSITRVLNQERSSMPEVDTAFTIREYPQLLWGHPSIWTGIYRREFLLENGIIFKEEKGGGWVDNPFFFDTLFSAKKIRWTKQPYYCYRKTNESSSSIGYDLRIPFERMNDNFDVAASRGYLDEESRKFMYARALMYLVGATNEPHYSYNEDYARPYIQSMLERMSSNVILDDFNTFDQHTYFKYRSPLYKMMPKTSKVLIYNWIPFDNPGGIGGGVTIYCRNLIQSLIKNRPDVQVYFLSSGWAYDLSSAKIYTRRIPNMFGERCRSFEIVNSPVPAAQDMLFYNPSVAFTNDELKDVFDDFIIKNGPFDVIHFNNIEGLSLDIPFLKKDYPNTKFIFSMHNYVPLCMTGFYFRRDEHHNCCPDHTYEDCDKCINRNDGRRLRRAIIDRARVNIPNPDTYDEDRWALHFGFEKLDQLCDAQDMVEFTDRAKDSINKNMDLVLAVSERVKTISLENGINEKLLKTSYIGTKIADFQMGYSSASEDSDYFTIAYLGSLLGYEEKGYPFLLRSLSRLDVEHASKVNLVLTTTTRDQDNYIREKLKHFHSINIIHGYTHSDIANILKGAHLGVVPVLWEDNLPQIAIEMVACGVPILSSDAGGASELCNDNRFHFKAGNTKDFLNKLLFFLDNRGSVQQFWSSHNGLVTMEKHIEEMIKHYDLPDAVTQIELSATDYVKLLEENEFLYNHFDANAQMRPVAYGISSDVLEAKDIEIRKLQNQISERYSDTTTHSDVEALKAERDDLQYHLDEIWNSRTFKLARAITALPRMIRSVGNE